MFVCQFVPLKFSGRGVIDNNEVWMLVTSNKCLGNRPSNSNMALAYHNLQQLAFQITYFKLCIKY